MPNSRKRSEEDIVVLVKLECRVDRAHKRVRGEKADGSKDETKAVRDHPHVAEVKRRLQHAAHGTPLKVVEEAVAVDKDSGGTAVQNTPPPPVVVLDGQLKVNERDRDEARHHQQQHKREEQDAKERVHLVTPDRRKDKVQLDVDRAEGQKTGDEHLQRRPAEPGRSGDLARHLGGPARRLKRRRVALAKDRPEHRERKGNQQVDQEHEHDRAERQRGARPVRDGDRVEHRKHQEEWAWQQDGGEDRGPHPAIAAHLLVERAGHVTRSARGESVQDEHHRAHGTLLSGRKDGEERQEQQ
mmetsp:Transcript_8532/g.24293  ORF Transcript_8532/g.24293 Transcript_8532/m.24293 type:complete len:299 (+) Transcript_8532:221-1117(+)